MELNDEFEVPLPVAEAWAVLTDIEKIAPCLPGIWLRQVEGDEYQGVVKVKVGPVTVSYGGVARYQLLDADAHKAVLEAQGRELRGQGNATALVTASLSPSTEGTRVQVVTALSVGGKLAQFSVDVMAGVSHKLLAEFARNLRLTVLAELETATPEPSDEPPSEPSDEPSSEPSSEPSDEPSDYLIAKKESLMKRLTPYLTVAGILLIARIVVYSLRRRRR
jgi:hypothetical protein